MQKIHLNAAHCLTDRRAPPMRAFANA